MATVNIPTTGGRNDPHYRYKMPSLESKKEGGGNGKATSILNVGDVAKAIKRPPEYMVKWFGITLGTKSVGKSTNKKGGIDMALVSGHHDTADLQCHLDGFIEKYVLCQAKGCKLPEVDLLISAKKSGRMVRGCCRACGWKGDLDNDHQLAAFIAQNPPSHSGLSLQTASESGSKGHKEAKREKKKELQRREAHASDGDTEEAVLAVGEVATEKCVTKEEKVLDKQSTEDRKELKETAETNAACKGTVENSSSMDERSLKVHCSDEDVQCIITSLQDHRAKMGSQLDDPQVETFYEQVRSFQLDNRVQLYVVLEVLCGDAMDAIFIETHKHVIDKFITASHMVDHEVLWAFSAYLERHPSTSKGKHGFPMILKTIYDEDWVDEAGMLAYFNQDQGQGEPGFQEAKQAAAKFLHWLETVESENDD